MRVDFNKSIYQEGKFTNIYDFAGNAENKRLRKPTKRLLESAEEYEQIFATKKKSKKSPSESSTSVRCSLSQLSPDNHVTLNASSDVSLVCPQMEVEIYVPAQETSGPTLLHNLGAGLEAVTSTPSHDVALDASSEHGPSEDEAYSVVSSVSPVTTHPPPNTDTEQEPHLAPKTGKCTLLLYASVR